MRASYASALLLFPLLACGPDDIPPLALSASEVRELPMLETVAVVEMTREEFAADAAARGSSPWTGTAWASGRPT